MRPILKPFTMINACVTVQRSTTSEGRTPSTLLTRGDIVRQEQGRKVAKPRGWKGPCRGKIAPWDLPALRPAG